MKDHVGSRPPLPGLQFPHSNDLRVLLLDCGAASEPVGTSWRNATEAAAAARLVRHCTAQGLLDVVVLTAYEAQRRLLAEGLKVPVATVDGFQGAEADLVVFSAVRHGRLGFVKDPRRLNVALTRARRGLVVLADRQALLESPDWRAWVEWLEAEGGVKSLDQLAEVLV